MENEIKKKVRRYSIVSRKSQYKDVYRRTIEIPQCVRISKANCSGRQVSYFFLLFGVCPTFSYF